MWLIRTSATVLTWKPSAAETGTMSFQPSSPSTSLPSSATASSCSVRACRSTRSALVTRAITGLRPTAASWAAMNLSPGPIFSLAGMQNPIASTSASVSATSSFRRLPSSVRGRCRPGVSTRISWASSRWTIPRMVCRVVCGLAEVMATFLPTSALVRVDLPALGRPTSTENPAWYLPNGSPPSALFCLLTWNSLLHWFGLVEKIVKVSVVWNGVFRRSGRDDVTDAVPAAFQPLGPQRNAVEIHGAAHDRDPAQGLGHQAAHGVHLVVVKFDAEQLAEVVNPHPGAHPVRAIAQVHDGGALGIVFVHDRAHELLEQVLHRHQPDRPAVFVDDDGHVGRFLLQFPEEVADRLGIRNVPDFTGQGVHHRRLSLRVEAVDLGSDVLEVDDAQDLVGVFADDRNPGVARPQEQCHGAMEAGAGVDGQDVRPRHHDGADQGVAELEDGLDEFGFVVLDHVRLGGPVNQLAELLLAEVGVVPVRRTRGHGTAQPDQP